MKQKKVYFSYFIVFFLNFLLVENLFSQSLASPKFSQRGSEKSFNQNNQQAVDCSIHIAGKTGCRITLKNLCYIYQPVFSEECQGSATVLFPSQISSMEEADILLYFHGVGPQEITNSTTEQIQRLKEPRYRYDRIFEQILENKHDAMIAIIPHGSEHAQFSPLIHKEQQNLVIEEPKGFLVDRFLKEVMERLKQEEKISSSFQMHGLILAAHSAGGLTLLRLLENPKIWRLPVNKLRMVTLLDAINGDDFELPFLKNFLTCFLQGKNQIPYDCSFFSEREPNANPFYFRAYYTQVSPYPFLHEQLQKTLREIVSQKGKDQFEITANFRVLSMDKFLQKKVGHSEIIRLSLRYALRVLPVYHP